MTQPDVMATMAVAFVAFFLPIGLSTTWRHDPAMLVPGIVWALLGGATALAYMLFLPALFLLDSEGAAKAFGIWSITFGEAMIGIMMLMGFNGGSERQTSLILRADSRITFVTTFVGIIFVFSFVIEYLRGSTEYYVSKLLGLMVLQFVFGSLPKHVNAIFGVGLELKK